MKKRITINDIAKAANVSKSTVSNYLNGRFETMSSDTKQNLEEIIEAFDYRPSKQAQSLKSKKSYLIGIVVVDISNLYTSRWLKGVLNEINKTGYNTIILDSNYSVERERSNMEKLVDENVDGIILQPLAQSSADYDYMPPHIPVVQVDRFVKPLIWPSFDSNNFEASYDLTKEITKHGYQDILIISPAIDGSSPRMDRLEGVKKGIEGTDVKLSILTTKDIRNTDSAQEGIRRAVQKIVRSGRRTALFAFNGGLLYGIVGILRQEGIAYPEEIGLVGYDDNGLGDLITPGITAIEQNPNGIGACATQLLLAELCHEEVKIDNYKVTSQMKIRQSL
jgi:LacI family kdg operon repressor